MLHYYFTLNSVICCVTSASEMTYIVSGGALNSLTHCCVTAHTFSSTQKSLGGITARMSPKHVMWTIEIFAERNLSRSRNICPPCGARKGGWLMRNWGELGDRGGDGRPPGVLGSKYSPDTVTGLKLSRSYATLLYTQVLSAADFDNSHSTLHRKATSASTEWSCVC